MWPPSIYDSLSFVLPGGTVLFTTVYGWNGWPYPEPGATAAIGLLAAAFVVGHLNAALAAFLELLAWRHRPGQPMSSTWGLFGPGGVYTAAEQDAIKAEMAAKLERQERFQVLFNLGYTTLQHAGKDEQLKIFNQQLGFYRNMSTATAVSAVATCAYAIAGRDWLPAAIWAPIYVVATLLFAYRYRRFWRRFADAVIRGIRTLSG